MSKIIGIDLGTTNSCVAVMEGGEATVIANAEGARTTPSVVGFTKNGERLVGQLAKRQAVVNPDRTVSSIKREMGTDYRVHIDDKAYTPQEISAMILTKLKKDAEDYLGQKIEKAVITVPAYFSDSQRQATKDAGKIAGLEVMRIIHEPTAAALAYGLDKGDKSQKILIYDLGGGTFDVSILELGDGVFEVLATNGNTRLGGDDFDKRIMDWIVSEFKNANGIDLSSDKMAMQRVKEAAEKAKIELSGMTKVNINLPFITVGANGPLHIDLDLTRAKFDDMTADLVKATVGPTLQALKDAGLKMADLDKVVLVGGSTRIPAVVDAVKNVTGKEPYKGINPDECVAIGAAIQGGVLAGDVKDVLTALLPLVRETKRPEWMAKVAEWKGKDYKPQDKEGVLRPHQIMRQITAALDEDAIIATDVGQHQMWAAQYCGKIKPRHFITSGGLGTMGYGFGASIGAQVAKPQSRVVMVTGDGSFHMNLNEMCTAVSFGLPIVVVVMNNHVLGMVRQWQTLFYDKRYSATTLDRKTDYVKLADAFGGLGFRATTEEEFKEVFAKALASGRPCIIDAVIDRDERVLPMIAPGCTIDEIIM